MNGQPDLFDAAFSTVVPEQPAILILVEDRERFVARVSVPGVFGREDDGVGRVTFPAPDAVA